MSEMVCFKSTARFTRCSTPEVGAPEVSFPTSHFPVPVKTKTCTINIGKYRTHLFILKLNCTFMIVLIRLRYLKSLKKSIEQCFLCGIYARSSRIIFKAEIPQSFSFYPLRVLKARLP